MTLEKFRIYHSTLIEHYQFIEAHLEGIYAAVSGKNLIAGLKDVEKDSINRIVNEIKAIEKEKGISIFTEEEYSVLSIISNRRNFWCHNCYYDLRFDDKTGGLKRDSDAQMMIENLLEAEKLRDELFDKKMELFDKNRSVLMDFRSLF